MNKVLLTALMCLQLTVFANAQNNTGTASTAEPVNAVKKRGPVFRATKEQVTEVQTMLKEKGSYKGEADGKFSADFRNAIKDFQGNNALKKTGTLNRATLEKMGIDLTDKQKEYPVNPNSLDTSDNDKPEKTKKSRAIAFRVNKDQISRAQTMLKDKGSYAGEITGKYSKDFRASVKDFQSANGLKRKGSLNRATLEKMGIELTDTQKEIPINPNDIAKPKAEGSAGNSKRKIFRATKEQISEVQRMLKEKGLYDGDQTGKLNSATRTAIGEWQNQNNVKKTGTLNKETLEAMKIELTEKQKAF